MSENSSARVSNLVAIGVLVIALAAVFFVGQSLGDDDSGDGDPVNAASGTETFGVVTGGEASISGTPDQLRFSASVHNTRSTTAAAMESTNRDVRAITQAAKRTGVAGKDIQTRIVSIRPSYEYDRSGRHLVGYTSTQSVKVLVRDLKKAGRIIGAVATAAGNAASISGITVSISNRDELVAKARTNAVKKSKAAAVALAKAAGQDVGKLEYVEEVVPQNVYGRGYYPEALSAGASLYSADAAKAVVISPGKQQVSVTVKVRWSLGD